MLIICIIILVMSVITYVNTKNNTLSLGGIQVYPGVIMDVSDTSTTVKLSKISYIDTQHFELIEEDSTIRIKSHGIYEISYSLTFSNTNNSGGQYASISGAVHHNNALLVNSSSSCFLRKQGTSSIITSCGKSILFNAKMESTISLVCMRIKGTTSCQTIADECSLTIIKIS